MVPEKPYFSKFVWFGVTPPQHPPTRFGKRPHFSREIFCATFPYLLIVIFASSMLRLFIIIFSSQTVFTASFCLFDLFSNRITSRLHVYLFLSCFFLSLSARHLNYPRQCFWGFSSYKISVFVFVFVMVCVIYIVYVFNGRVSSAKMA